MTNEKTFCEICQCETGGGAFCYEHAPYMVYPQADGSFVSERHGRKRIWKDDLATDEIKERVVLSVEAAPDGK